MVIIGLRFLKFIHFLMLRLWLPISFAKSTPDLLYVWFHSPHHPFYINFLIMITLLDIFRIVAWGLRPDTFPDVL